MNVQLRVRKKRREGKNAKHSNAEHNFGHLHYLIHIKVQALIINMINSVILVLNIDTII